MKGYLFRSLIALGCLSSVYISDVWGASPSPQPLETAVTAPFGVTDPVSISDSIRGIEGALVNLLKLGEEPEVGAELVALQAQVGALMDGTTSYVSEPGTGKPDSGTMPLDTYTYLHNTYLTGKIKTPYSPLNKKLTDSADMEQVVKEMFFLENNADATEEKQIAIQKERDQYLTKIAKDYIRTAYTVQQKLIEDMNVVSSDINGDGSIGATSGTDQTWKAINRALIADIVMQIQLMELDAAKFLSVQPILLMTKEDVQATDDGADTGSDTGAGSDEGADTGSDTGSDTGAGSDEGASGSADDGEGEGA